MTELPASPLGLYFRFKVIVVTKFSQVQGAISVPLLVADKPADPTNAPTRNALTSKSTIVVDITTISTVNGSPILSYHVEIDDGLGGSFREVQGLTTNSLSLTATYSNGIYAGRNYRVQYRAKNIIGWTDFSPIGSILAAYLPDTPIPPVVTITGTFAKVQFYLPFNQGSDIT